jgi:hypothetical protein
MRNNIGYPNKNTNMTGVDTMFNSWDLSITPATTDFASTTDPSVNMTGMQIEGMGALGPRQADGSLPNVDFMHLSATSRFIDKGTDVKLPFVGAAPDLGAYEYGAASTGTGGSTGAGGGTGGSIGAGGRGGTGGSGTGGTGRGGTTGGAGRGGAGGTTAGTAGSGSGGSATTGAAGTGTTGTGGTTAGTAGSGAGGSGTTGTGGSIGAGSGGSNATGSGGSSTTGTGGSSTTGSGGSNATGSGGSGPGEAGSGGCSCAIDAPSGRATFGSLMALLAALSFLAGRRNHRRPHAWSRVFTSASPKGSRPARRSSSSS